MLDQGSAPCHRHIVGNVLPSVGKAAGGVNENRRIKGRGADAATHGSKPGRLAAEGIADSHTRGADRGERRGAVGFRRVALDVRFAAKHKRASLIVAADLAATGEAAVVRSGDGSAPTVII